MAGYNREMFFRINNHCGFVQLSSDESNVLIYGKGMRDYFNLGPDKFTAVPYQEFKDKIAISKMQGDRILFLDDWKIIKESEFWKLITGT